jgi:hypothetical protein
MFQHPHHLPQCYFSLAVAHVLFRCRQASLYLPHPQPCVNPIRTLCFFPELAVSPRLVCFIYPCERAATSGFFLSSAILKKEIAVWRGAREIKETYTLVRDKNAIYVDVKANRATQRSRNLELFTARLAVFFKCKFYCVPRSHLFFASIPFLLLLRASSIHLSNQIIPPPPPTLCAFVCLLPLLLFFPRLSYVRFF